MLCVAGTSSGIASLPILWGTPPPQPQGPAVTGRTAEEQHSHFCFNKARKGGEKKNMGIRPKSSRRLVLPQRGLAKSQYLLPGGDGDGHPPSPAGQGSAAPPRVLLLVMSPKKGAGGDPEQCVWVRH